MQFLSENFKYIFATDFPLYWCYPFSCFDNYCPQQNAGVLYNSISIASTKFFTLCWNLYIYRTVPIFWNPFLFRFYHCFLYFTIEMLLELPLYIWHSINQHPSHSLLYLKELSLSHAFKLWSKIFFEKSTKNLNYLHQWGPGFFFYRFEIIEVMVQCSSTFSFFKAKVCPIYILSTCIYLVMKK